MGRNKGGLQETVGSRGLSDVSAAENNVSAEHQALHKKTQNIAQENTQHCKVNTEHKKTPKTGHSGYCKRWDVQLLLGDWRVPRPLLIIFNHEQ